MTLAQSDKVIAIRQSAAALPPISLSLDDLIAAAAPVVQAQMEKDAAAKAERDRKKAEKAAIDKARREAAMLDVGGLNQAQRAELRAKVLLWEAENKWEPIAFVALEQVDTCLNCGNQHPHIVGVYQSQQLRHRHADKRFVLWTPEMASDKTTPRQLLTVEKTVHVCSECAWEQGFVGQFSSEAIDVVAVLAQNSVAGLGHTAPEMGEEKGKGGNYDEAES